MHSIDAPPLPVVNARLAWHGLARDLRTERPKAAAIKRAAAAALTDEAMRDRMAHVAQRLATYDSVELVTHAILGGRSGADAGHADTTRVDQDWIPPRG